MSNNDYSVTLFSEEPCWLYSCCPCKTASCRASQPEDMGCPIYRRFKAIFMKQGLLKENVQ